MANFNAGLRMLDTLLRLGFASRSDRRADAREKRLLDAESVRVSRSRGVERAGLVAEAFEDPDKPIDVLQAQARNAGLTFEPGQFVDRATRRVRGVPARGQVRSDILTKDLETARSGAAPNTFARDLVKHGGVSMAQFTGMDEGQQRAVVNSIRQAGKPIPNRFDFFELPEGVEFDVSGPDFFSEGGRAFRDRSQSALKTKRLTDVADQAAAQTGGASAASLPFQIDRENRAQGREIVDKFGTKISDSLVTSLRDARKFVPGLTDAESTGDVLIALFRAFRRGDVGPEVIQRAVKNAGAEIAVHFLTIATDDNAEVLLGMIPPAVLPHFRSALEQLRPLGQR